MNAFALSFDTAGMVSILVGLVLPLLTGFLTKQSWNRDLKGIILLALAGVSSILSQWATALNGHFHLDWKATALNALLTFLTALAGHYGIWKGGAFQSILQNSGIKDASSYPDDTGTGVLPVLPPEAPADSGHADASMLMKIAAVIALGSILTSLSRLMHASQFAQDIAIVAVVVLAWFAAVGIALAAKRDAGRIGVRGSESAHRGVRVTDSSTAR